MARRSRVFRAQHSLQISEIEDARVGAEKEMRLDVDPHGYHEVHDSIHVATGLRHSWCQGTGMRSTSSDGTERDELAGEWEP